MAKWAEIKCPRCAEQDALWEGMERALEESDAREARLEAKLAKAVVRLEAIKRMARFLNKGPLATDKWVYHIEDNARDAIAELKGQGDD